VFAGRRYYWSSIGVDGCQVPGYQVQNFPGPVEYLWIGSAVVTTAVDPMLILRSHGLNYTCMLLMLFLFFVNRLTYIFFFSCLQITLNEHLTINLCQYCGPNPPFNPNLV